MTSTTRGNGERAGRPTTPTDLHRLAALARERGLRLLRESATGGWYATSASEADTIHFVTALSCTCAGFCEHGRCSHNAALLDRLGWLPDLDPEPDPEPAAAAVAAAATIACDACGGRGGEMVEATSGDRTRVPCRRCDGSGEIPVGEEPEEPDGDTSGPAIAIVPAGTGGAGHPVAPPEAGAGAAVTGADGGAGTEAARPPIALVPAADRATALAATVDGAVERLAEQLAEGHTAEFLATLGLFDRFRRYSARNVLLIMAQRPDATLVAGMRRWNEIGYRIKAGEKALWIQAPIVKKEIDERTGEEVEAMVGFRPAPVFDASQLANLEERPLPAPDRPQPDDAGELYAAVAARIVAAGIPVEERALPGGVPGVSRGGGILVRAGLDSRTRLAVLLHELVHELEHHGGGTGGKPVHLMEFEAESAAYVAAAALGVEHPTARDYLLGWRGSAEQLRGSLADVQRIVRRVMAVVAPPEAGAEEGVMAA